jgi:glycosyltransferase involved in cell wall biosynthesis
VTTSVVVPTRNRGALLEEAVESALAATGVDEVVVADGGSTDGSLEALRRFGDRIRIVEGDYPNAAATRNAGARAARGQLIAFLDSDDLMLPDKVPCLVRVLEEDSAIALAHGRTIVIDETGTVDERATQAHAAQIEEGRRRGTRYVDLAHFCAMYTSATVIRRDAFFAVGGYDEQLDAYEDWDLYLRLSLEHRIVYAECLSARYRVWPGNVAWDRTAHWTSRVASKHLASPPVLPRADAAAARYALLVRLARSNHVLVRRRESRRAALDAVRTAPTRALTDTEILGLIARSFVPAFVLRRRRPS